MGSILEARDLRFEYLRDHPVLTNINFKLFAGKNLGIVGESGSGKSTLLRLILAFHRPTSGEILYDGQDLSDFDNKQLRDFRTKVQVIFQDPYSSLDPRQRIDRLIAEPLTSLGLASANGGPTRLSRRHWIQDQVENAVRSVGLSPDLLKRYPSEFSGGERQRIAIARAIVCHPKVLLADEPVSALDVTTRMQIIDLLKELQETQGQTIIMVSHDLAVVAALCDETIVLEKGKIVEYGETSTVLGNPSQPYTRKLIESLPRLPR